MLLEPNHPAGEVVVVFGKVAKKKTGGVFVHRLKQSDQIKPTSCGTDVP